MSPSKQPSLQSNTEKNISEALEDLSSEKQLPPSRPRWRGRLGRAFDLLLWGVALFALYTIFTRDKSGPEEGTLAASHTFTVVGEAEGNLSSETQAQIVDGSRGKQLSLPGTRSKPLLIKAFASWCGACKRSVWLENMSDVSEAKGIDFVAVSVDENISLAASAKSSWPIKETVLFDETGAFSRDFNIKLLPTYILINAEGQVERVTSGLPGPMDFRAWKTAAQAAQ